MSTQHLKSYRLEIGGEMFLSENFLDEILFYYLQTGNYALVDKVIEYINRRYADDNSLLG